MKAIIEFNLPEDKEYFEVAQKAGAMYSAINAIYNNILRKRRKYTELPPEVKAEVQKMEEEFHKILSERGLNELV